MKHINLETFANGAFTAQVNRAMEEVTKNIQDPNTEPSATRKITVTIGFKPNQERNFVATGVQTKTTLAWARICVPERWKLWRSGTRFPVRCPWKMFRQHSCPEDPFRKSMDGLLMWRLVKFRKTDLQMLLI